jgi:DNA-binding Lrp family transcriptional regulator
MTNVELANRAGISAPPCLRRLRNLEDRGIILGYHAEINYKAVGYSATALCLVSTERQDTKATEEFLECINKLPKVRECSSTIGDFDYILKIVACDLADCENFISEYIKSIPNVVKVRTYIIIENNKCEKDLPLK